MSLWMNGYGTGCGYGFRGPPVPGPLPLPLPQSLGPPRTLVLIFMFSFLSRDRSSMSCEAARMKGRAGDVPNYLGWIFVAASLRVKSLARRGVDD